MVTGVVPDDLKNAFDRKPPIFVLERLAAIAASGEPFVPGTPRVKPTKEGNVAEVECAASLEGHVCFTAEIALPPTALDFNMGVIDFHFDGGMEIHIPVGVSPVDALAALRASSCANPDVVPPLTDAVPPLPAGMFVAPTLPHKRHALHRVFDCLRLYVRLSVLRQ